MTVEFTGKLRERVTLEMRILEQNDGGPQAGSYQPMAEVFAAVVLEGAGPEAEAAALSAMPRYRVTIRVGPQVQPGDRVRWGDRVLAVRQSLFDPRQADRLILRCEEVR